MFIRILSSLFLSLALSACAATFSMPPYVPVTTAEIDSGIEVQDFAYHPKSKVGPNIIHTTAAGVVQLTEPVSEYIAGAVRREFRQAGISLKPESSCYMEGDVNDLTIDDLGFSADYISDFRYVVKDRSQQTLFDSAYQVKFSTSKFVVAEVIFANLQKVISANIAKLMADPAFLKVADESCRKT